MLLWIIILFIILIEAVIIEQLYWRYKILQVHQYIYPILLEYNLVHIPVKPRIFGAITFDKQVITMCIRYNYTIQQLAYVLLHEYAHVLSINYGHGDEFWTRFQELLTVAERKKIFIDDHFAAAAYCKAPDGRLGQVASASADGLSAAINRWSDGKPATAAASSALRAPLAVDDQLRLV